MLSTASSSAEDLFQSVLPLVGVLLGFVIVGGVVIMLIRRRLGGGGESSAGGFTLYDLRELHRSGQLSDEEFQRARAQMIASLRPSDEAEPDDDGEQSPGKPGGSDDEGPSEVP